MCPKWVLRRVLYILFTFCASVSWADFISISRHGTAKWALFFLVVVIRLKTFNPSLELLTIWKSDQIRLFSISSHLPSCILPIKMFSWFIFYYYNRHIQITNHSNTNCSKKQPSDVKNHGVPLTFLCPSSYVIVPQPFLPRECPFKGDEASGENRSGLGLVPGQQDLGPVLWEYRRHVCVTPKERLEPWAGEREARDTEMRGWGPSSRGDGWLLSGTGGGPEAPGEP